MDPETHNAGGGNPRRQAERAPGWTGALSGELTMQRHTTYHEPPELESLGRLAP